MALRIKDEETHRLAKELAALTGETLTATVTVAIRERLEELRRRQGLAERLLAIGQEAAAHWPPELRDVDPTVFLYDEKGLPK